MTTLTASVTSVLVLSLAGLLPTLAVTGFRLIAIPLVPLSGSVLAAVAATCFLAVGGSFLSWFIALALIGSIAVAAMWIRFPRRRPWIPTWAQRPEVDRSFRLAGIGGAMAILIACVWNLRGLATPTVGFDARALWLMRSGWFLQSHHQLLVNMRLQYLSLGQTAYPPLVSAVSALAWCVTGVHSVRLGVVLITILNTCALAAAAFAFVEAGRRFSLRLSPGDNASSIDTASHRPAARHSRRADQRSWALLAPPLIGAICGVLLIFVAFGVTEPFMTNGYADPIWSLAAVGALAYGLQMELTPANQGIAFILLLVAGLSKNEGWATAVTLIALLVVRRLATMAAEDRRRLWWHPVAIGAIAVAVVSAWPIVIRVTHSRGTTMPYSPLHDIPGRTRSAFDGMTPYLHVIVLAAPLAILGGIVLSGVRRKCGAANDWWAWAGLASGLIAICAGYATATADIHLWLVGTVDRVTEFSTLAGWWIVAMWALTSSATPAVMQSVAGVEGCDSSTDQPLDGIGDGHGITQPSAVPAL